MKVQSLHPALKQKLDAKKAEYQKVMAFANLLPVFQKSIIDGEFTGESYAQLASRFGDLYCAWGINWYTNTPTNYPKEKHSEVGFVSIYLNCFSLFGDDCAEFGRAELVGVTKNIKVYFYDEWNTTFYFLPDEAEAGLKKLEQWFIATQQKCAEYLKQKRKNKLEKELASLQ